MNDLSIVATVITAVVTPLIGLLVWTIKKLVQAQIDYVTVLTKEFNEINTNLRAFRAEITALQKCFDDHHIKGRHNE